MNVPAGDEPADPDLIAELLAYDGLTERNLKILAHKRVTRLNQRIHRLASSYTARKLHEGAPVAPAFEWTAAECSARYAADITALRAELFVWTGILARLNMGDPWRVAIGIVTPEAER